MYAIVFSFIDIKFSCWPLSYLYSYALVVVSLIFVSFYAKTTTESSSAKDFPYISIGSSHAGRKITK